MYFEDYEVGMVFDEEIAPVTFTEEELIWAGKNFDPRKIHTDKDFVKDTHFGEVISPGSYSNMKFWSAWVKTGIDAEGMIAGLGVSYAKWLRPIFADTSYDIRVEVVDKKVRKPGYNGAVYFLMTAYDPEGEKVTEYCASGLVAFRDKT